MKKEQTKTIIYWAIMVCVLATYLCYYLLDWTTQVYNVSEALDAIIKSVATIILALGVSKLVGIIMAHLQVKSQRAQTVTKLLASVIKYAIAIVSLIIILTYFIEDTSSLITGISMLTLVIGLGAQSLINDIVSGIFIVFEGDYKVGDVVVIDGWRGTVMEIGIRTTKIEDMGGNVQIINNSKIAKVINNSKNLSLAVCDVGIEYGESIERVEHVLSSNWDEVKKNIPTILEGPYYKGIDSLGDSAVIIKIIAKCKEDDKYQVQRDLNREIKILFDKHNINIPYPQITVSQHKDADASISKAQKKSAKEFVAEQKELSKSIEENNE